MNTVYNSASRLSQETSYYVYTMWAALLFSALFAVYRGDWITVFVSILTLALSMYALHMSRKVGLRVPSSLLTATIFFIYFSLFWGEVYNYYERFWWWDVLLHAWSAIGFGLIGAITLIFIFRRNKVVASPFMISVFAFSFSLAIGALWEIVEFGLDIFLGWNLQKSGLFDTMGDLIVDTGGALIGAGAAYVYLRWNVRTFFASLMREVFDENISLP
ncbi:hypothetical protein KC727_02735 [Candidatus Kaiserbacteria bacterium]|nr:hypothetical protein [Candidatus Kaiserbacteria bacterium]